MKNCPNCGAPIEPYKCKCEHCGTWYFDFAAFNVTDGSPCYVKFNTPQGVITALAKPELTTTEIYCDEQYATDATGHIMHSFVTNKHCDFNVIFHTIINEDGTLFIVNVEQNEE